VLTDTFFKGATQGSSQQSLVEIGTIVSEEKNLFLFHLCSSALSCIHGGHHYKKMEISSNGQICSIISQKVPKFELYKHNDELFNIYYGIFYEL
jgi:hypothetical protein